MPENYPVVGERWALRETLNHQTPIVVWVAFTDCMISNFLGVAVEGAVQTRYKNRLDTFNSAATFMQLYEYCPNLMCRTFLARDVSIPMAEFPPGERVLVYLDDGTTVGFTYGDTSKTRRLPVEEFWAYFEPCYTPTKDIWERLMEDNDDA